jgi:nicotinamide riboside transporter PnuC
MSTEPSSPKRPFRDSALLYAGMAIVVVILVFITDGKMSVAIPVALACFLVATGYAWWKLKQRREEERRQQQEQEAS